jgi:hypothetical protein
VELVRFRLCHDIDDCSSGAPNFRGVEVRLDTKFRDRIDGRFHSNGADNAFVVVRAIDQLGIQGIGLPIGRQERGLSAIIGARTARKRRCRTFICAEGELRQLNEVSAIERQILDGLFRNRDTN